MIKIFNYIPELDAFICTEEYKYIAAKLHIAEWTPFVWIGRLLTLDNDYGEHIADNWDEREAIEEEAKKLGYDSGELFIVVPERFVNSYDGPCHTRQQIKSFWTGVFKSLSLDLETIIQEARDVDEKRRKYGDETEYNLEEEIAKIKSLYSALPWKPIELAPKKISLDGRELDWGPDLLLYCNNSVIKGYWCGQTQQWEDCGEGFPLKPSFWMELPNAPIQN
jgi:hypothetical protein